MLKEICPPILADVIEAEKRIAPFIHRTPILTSRCINELLGAEVFFKCENFQKVGAFKIRGAVNAVFSLEPHELKNGVVTFSSGNHGQALALAARERGIPAYVVMPKSSRKIKVQSVKGYGANVIFCEQDDDSTQAVLNEVIEKTGAKFIHPFNDYNVIEGQATATKELIEEISDLDVIAVPVGGGGLLSGACIVCNEMAQGIKLYASEPTGADDTYRSLKTGSPQPVGPVNTIADGLLSSIGDKTFPIIQEHLSELFLVDDDQIVEAMRMIWERMNVIVEPSSAVALTGLLNNKSTISGKRIGLIFTGGNVDLSDLPF